MRKTYPSLYLSHVIVKNLEKANAATKHVEYTKSSGKHMLSTLLTSSINTTVRPFILDRME